MEIRHFRAKPSGLMLLAFEKEQWARRVAGGIDRFDDTKPSGVSCHLFVCKCGISDIS